MRYGIYAPNFGEYGDAATLATLARESEEAGWDGFFIWDTVVFDPAWAVPIVDPWIALTAIATATERLVFGPLVTPPARQRPWIVARQAASLDVLSNGRFVLGVGLGEPPTDFSQFGEDADRRVRAAKLDEALAIIDGLWSGEPFGFMGTHFQVHETTFVPRPVQRPRIPIWVAGGWPRQAPFRRAARWDGVFPLRAGSVGPEDWMLSPDEIREMGALIAGLRQSDRPFEVVVGGETSGGDASGSGDPAAYAAAGATWWLEAIHGMRGALDDMRARIRRGPPR